MNKFINKKIIISVCILLLIIVIVFFANKYAKTNQLSEEILKMAAQTILNRGSRSSSSSSSGCFPPRRIDVTIDLGPYNTRNQAYDSAADMCRKIVGLGTVADGCQVGFGRFGQNGWYISLTITKLPKCFR